MQQPTPADLPALRKGLRKRSVPEVRLNMAGNAEGLGRFAVDQTSDGFLIKWQLSGEEQKEAMFAELCSSPAKELERLELGWLIAEVAGREAQRLMDAIGGPNEAWA
jgi:hypothetical protein